jgi:hypothetical protein
MASIINASTSGAGGLISTADNSGTLQLQTASTTAMTINSSQVVNFANSPTIAGSAFPSGALTLISTQTANNTSSSIAWTGLSGYKNYLLVFNQLVLAGTTDYNFYLRVGTGAGPTYLTANYQYGGYFQRLNLSSLNVTSSTSAAYMIINGGTLAAQGNAGATYGISGTVYVENMNISGGQVVSYGQSVFLDNTFTYAQSSFGGTQTGTQGPYTAIQLTNGGGVNIYSGTASLYGISS